MTQDIGEARYQKVRLDLLTTDGRFNRPVREAHVRQIMSDFTPGAFGVIELWRREDDSLVILDGQHRVESLRRMGYPENVRCLPSLVHENLTLDLAAELFVKLNASKLVNAWDRFKALLVAGHSQTCDIDRIVKAQGLRAGTASSHSAGTVSAIGALISVYQMGEPEGAILASSLKALYSAWGELAEAYRGPLLRGVALYFHEHRDTSPETLADALVRGPGAPINLLGWAQAIAGKQRMNMAEAIAQTIEQRVMARRSKPRSA